MISAHQIFGYSSYYSWRADSDFFAAFLAVFGTIMLFSLVFYIFWVIGAWKVLEKAGEKGWKAIIPIYNIVIFLKIAGLSPWWALGILVGPVNLFVTFYRNIELAKRFNKGVGYGVLMAFFEPIMYMILGFGSAEYTAPEVTGEATNSSGYAKQMEEYNAAYAKYQEDVKKYNAAIAKDKKATGKK